MSLDINKLKNRKLLVIGDVMVDTYYLGKVKRISPEAPVPIVQVNQTYSSLGGAANVARNLSTLGCYPKVIGLTGNDANGEILKKLLLDLQIENQLVAANHPTITKTRIIGNHQQIARIDFEPENFVLPEETESQILRIALKDIPQFDAVIISDYGKGLCTYRICQQIITEAKLQNKPVIIDPKGTNWDKYARATFVTPNLKELSDITGLEIKNEDEAIQMQAQALLSKFRLENLLITRSEKGMSLCSDSLQYDVKAQAKEVYDVSGAGDTVVATLSAALAASLSLKESVWLANKAASIVVAKMGTTPIHFQELLQEIKDCSYSDKIVNQEQLSEILISLRSKNKKIVFTNGCFDILHKGHIFYLQEAKKRGDILIVGLNSDHSVRRLKGDTRPINKEDDRAAVLGALECIDYVIIFKEDTPYDLIKEVQPDSLIKGGDYKIEDIVGHEFAREVSVIDFQEGYSSTNLIQKLTR